MKSQRRYPLTYMIDFQFVEAIDALALGSLKSKSDVVNEALALFFGVELPAKPAKKEKPPKRPVGRPRKEPQTGGVGRRLEDDRIEWDD